MAVVLLLPMATRATAAQPAIAARSTAASNVNTFVPTNPMSARRSGATATLLGDGDVLVAGGGTAGAELYHPATGTWSRTASMTVARTNATATLLPDGKVLVAGGCCTPGNPYVGLRSAELYDPTTGSWSATGSLNVARSGHTATLLQNGEVLVAGGACNGLYYGCDGGSFLVNLKSAELYDPSTGMWTKTGSMSAGREFHTATLLANGEVLVAGGFNSCDDTFCTDLYTAERYDPLTGKWLRTASMHQPREQQTATLLTNGDVLVAGGLNAGGSLGFPSTYASTEIYDPIFNRWTAAAPMNEARAGHAATLLPGGWVLVAGGGTASSAGGRTATSEVYEPSLNVWVPTGNLSTARIDQSATALNNGDVLIAGGRGPDGQPLSTAEVYQYGAGPLVSLSAKRLTFPTQEVGTTGNALAITVTNNGTGPLDVSGVATSGLDPSDFVARSSCGQPVAVGSSCAVLVRFSPLVPGLRQATVAITDNAPLDPQAVGLSGYSAGPDVWSPTGSMIDQRQNFSTTLLNDGQVLVAGGMDVFSSTIASAELYDPSTASFTPTGSMGTAREFQASARLPDGSVLVAGGLNVTPYSETLLSSAEIYSPATGRWSPTGSMAATGDGLTAKLLGNGLVLVTGFFGSNPELYDPAHGTWSSTGPLPQSGSYGLAVLLHNGTVLLTGGPNGASALYQPATNTWSPTGSMSASHNGGTATTLTDGDVLVVGGLAANGGGPLSGAELYNPAKGTWTATESLPVARQGQSAVLLANGGVLVAGGCSSDCHSSPATESTYIYNGGFWGPTGSLPASRYGQGMIALPDGDVLLAGGSIDNSANASATAERYIPTLVSASPGQAAPGQTVTITGNGFYAHEVVVVRLSGAPAQGVIATVRANDLGRFSGGVAVPSVPPGTHQLSAQGQTSLAFAGRTFVVT